MVELTKPDVGGPEPEDTAVGEEPGGERLEELDGPGTVVIGGAEVEAGAEETVPGIVADGAADAMEDVATTARGANPVSLLD
jgi:hypothetical protein